MFRLAIRYQLRAYGSNATSDEILAISNKRNRLQTLIDSFEHQADSFLLNQQGSDDPEMSSLGDYHQFDNVDDLHDVDDLANASDHHTAHPTSANHSSYLFSTISDESENETLNPEEYPILLPSSFGWDWCSSHGLQSLAVKEAKLRHAQANWSIHQIRLALGLKSTLYRTQVRHATTQDTKTRARNALHSVDKTVHEHARIYSMAHDAFGKIRSAHPRAPELPQLLPEDLRVATLILGSDQVGQRNKQRSWIWGFGDKENRDGTYMDDCKSLILWV